MLLLDAIGFEYFVRYLFLSEAFALFILLIYLLTVPLDRPIPTPGGWYPLFLRYRATLEAA